jgi:hypothetical protein
MGLEQVSDLKVLDGELAKEFMKGLWAREERINRKPEPFGRPHLWKWSKIRQGLAAAGKLVTTNYKGARRAITLVHPNLDDGTSFTLPLFSLMSKPEIRSLKDLKGKVLGVATLTSGESLLSRRLLKDAGVPKAANFKIMPGLMMAN